MGISASGATKLSSSNLAKALITVLIFLVIFTFFYGPPLVPALRNAAIDKCTQALGWDFQIYDVRWKSWTLDEKPFPHWECANPKKPGADPIDLGWYAGFKA